MKRVTCIITAFLTFILISVNSFAVYALPAVIPSTFTGTFNSTVSDGANQQLKVYGHFILYDPDTDKYSLNTVWTSEGYCVDDYITLDFDSFTGSYFINVQEHLSATSVISQSSWCRKLSNGRYIFDYYIDNKYNQGQLVSELSSFRIRGSLGYEIALSTIHFKYNDELFFNADESDFFARFVDTGYGNCKPPTPDRVTPVVPVVPTEPTTEAPTIGEGDYEGDSAETSKNILDNVKQILTNIANLPKNIANAIYNFFSDLLSGILTGLNNLKDGLIQGLKDLFIPSDNAFTDIKDIVNEKFGFISQIKDLLSAFVNYTFADSDTPPEFNINYKGKEISIIDWSLYAPYRMTVHFIIIAISYLSFIMRLYKRLPGYIGGFY